MDYRFKYLVVSIVSLWLVGCAPTPTKPPTVANPTSQMMASTGLKKMGGSGDLTSWYCPGSPNVTLKDDVGFGGFDSTGSEDFTVCVHRDDNTKFRISGNTSSKSLCVYPMMTASGSSISLVEAPKCFAIGSTAIEADFVSKSINYFVVVDANYTAALNSCLSGTSACPPHSEGFVQ
jgi:hypothetical protein